MDQGIAWQAQAKMPPKLLEIVKQPLMHEAAISQQGDHHARQHDGTHLIEYRLIGFKTNLGASMAQGSPSQRNRPTTIDEGGTDQYKGGESSGIQGDRQTLISGPVDQGSPDHRPIPIWGNNPRMMQPAGEAALATGSVQCLALGHLSPG